jgi:hypothetical protein
MQPDSKGLAPMKGQLPAHRIENEFESRPRNMVNTNS